MPLRTWSAGSSSARTRSPYHFFFARGKCSDDFFVFAVSTATLIAAVFSTLIRPIKVVGRDVIRANGGKLAQAKPATL